MMVRSDRVRIGYVSSDLGDHPLCHLLANALCWHDPEQCDVFMCVASRCRVLPCVALRCAASRRVTPAVRGVEAVRVVAHVVWRRAPLQSEHQPCAHGMVAWH